MANNNLSDELSVYGRIAVIYGGSAAEREVSLASGQAVFSALKTVVADCIAIDIDDDPITILQNQSFDTALIIVHGRGGEDGTLQALLQFMGKAYTGSGVLASALAMDKLKTKQVWQGGQLATPAFAIVHSIDKAKQQAQCIGYPLMVKPIREGSSVGMAKVDSEEQLLTAIHHAKQYDDVMLEQYINGREYTVPILAGQPLSPIRLETQRVFYDYHAKYQSDDTGYFIPCGLDEEQEQKLKDLAMQAFSLLGCEGWGRVDVMQDQQGNFWPLEVNTVPGMTDHSLVPISAAHEGISFIELVVKILHTARREKR